MEAMIESFTFGRLESSWICAADFCAEYFSKFVRLFLSAETIGESPSDNAHNSADNQCGRSGDTQHILASPRIRERNEATNLYYLHRRHEHTASTTDNEGLRKLLDYARDASTKPRHVAADNTRFNEVAAYCRG